MITNNQDFPNLKLFWANGSLKCFYFSDFSLSLSLSLSLFFIFHALCWFSLLYMYMCPVLVVVGWCLDWFCLGRCCSLSPLWPPALILASVSSIWAKFSNGDCNRDRPGERRRWVPPLCCVSCMLLQSQSATSPSILFHHCFLIPNVRCQSLWSKTVWLCFTCHVFCWLTGPVM